MGCARAGRHRSGAMAIRGALPLPPCNKFLRYRNRMPAAGSVGVAQLQVLFYCWLCYFTRGVQEDMAPKLAMLRQECVKLGLSWDRAETLAMLIADATVPQIIDTLKRYSDSFDGVRSTPHRSRRCAMFAQGTRGTQPSG